MNPRNKPHISFYRVGETSFVKIDISHLPMKSPIPEFKESVSPFRWGRRMRTVQRYFREAVDYAGRHHFNALTGQQFHVCPTKWEYIRALTKAQDERIMRGTNFQEYKARRLAEMKAAGIEP